MAPRVAPEPYSPEAVERIWARTIVSESGCWEWQLATDAKGYGQIKLGRVQTGTRGTYRVHVAAYRALFGDVGEGLELDHLCRNRRCWRPDHLEPVPHKVNVLRGESPAARHAVKSHCPQGHPYDAANTYIIPSSGRRVCRICKRESNRERERLHPRRRRVKTGSDVWR